MARELHELPIPGIVRHRWRCPCGEEHLVKIRRGGHEPFLVRCWCRRAWRISIPELRAPALGGPNKLDIEEAELDAVVEEMWGPDGRGNIGAVWPDLPPAEENP